MRKGYALGILLTVQSWACQSPLPGQVNNAPGGSPSDLGDAQISLTFANVTKEALDTLRLAVEDAFKREAIRAAGECKKDDDPCQESKVHAVRLNYESVVSKVNAAATLQNTLAALTDAEVDCIKRGDRSCADEKERAILSQIPNLITLVDVIKDALPKRNK